MTEEQEQMLEALRAAAWTNNLVNAPEAFLHTPRVVGDLVLALATERDLLRGWLEAEILALQSQLAYAELNPEPPRETVSEEVLDAADDAMEVAAKKRDAAKAACLAAGGKE